MPVNPFISPFKHTIKPSLQKWLIVLLPHILVMLLIISISIFSWWLKILLLLLMCFSVIYYSRLHLLQNLEKSVLSIQQDSANNWLITLKEEGGDTKEEREMTQKNVELLPSSFFSRLYIILNFSDANHKKYNTLIAPDSISINKFRYLRVRLKLTYPKNK